MRKHVTNASARLLAGLLAIGAAACGAESASLVPGASSVYSPGAPWEGKGTGPWSMDDVEAFDGYDVYWVGPTFGPYNLQAVSHTSYGNAPDGHNQDMVSFFYGRCMPPPDTEGCSVPATIHVQPICLLPPDLAPPSHGEHRERRATAQ